MALQAAACLERGCSPATRGSECCGTSNAGYEPALNLPARPACALPCRRHRANEPGAPLSAMPVNCSRARSAEPRRGAISRMSVISERSVLHRDGAIEAAGAADEIERLPLARNAEEIDAPAAW